MRTPRAALVLGLALSTAFVACTPSVETGSAAATAGSTGSGGAPSTTSTQSSASTTTTSSSTGGGQGGSSTSSTSSASGGGGQGGAGGCDADNACEAGLTCCGNACVDLVHDLLHCGACDVACTPAPQVILACESGACVTNLCAPNYADCNGSPIDGCEQNLLQDDPCACIPGETKPCYTGGPGTLGVGPCHGGIQICNVDGLAWSECQGQTQPSGEVCANGIDEDCNGVADDFIDIDGDGWTVCDGDCNELNSPQNPGKPTPNMVNPGAFEIFNNGIDDDCDPSTPDQGPAITCSPGALVSPVSPDDLVKALDLCQVTELSPPLAQKRWGVIGASFLLADGSAPSAAQLASMQSMQTAVLTHFGDVLVPKKGGTMAGLSTGKMRDASAPDFVANGLGTNLGSASSPPAKYLAAHGGVLPSNSGCNGNCPSGAGAFDSVRLHVTLRVPTNALSFSYDLRLFSAEYGAHSCSPYNDAFLVLLDTQAPGIPADGNIAFDTFNNPLVVNDLFFDSCLSQGCNLCPLGASVLAGTGMELGGATQWLTSDAPVKPGEIMQIDWTIFDVTDGSGDSHVLLDNFYWRGPCYNCGGDH